MDKEQKRHAVWTTEREGFTEYASFCGPEIVGTLVSDLDRVTCPKCIKGLKERGFID